MKIKYALPIVLLCFNIPGVSTPSSVTIGTASGVCVEIGTKNARFDLPSGYVRAYLLESVRSATLDDPGPHGTTAVVVNGKQIDDFHLDCAHARSTEVIGRLGSAAKRVEVRGRSSELPNVQETIAFEIYDDFPNVLVSSVAWRNTGRTDLALERATVQNQRLNASKIDPGIPAYGMWSFQGSRRSMGQR